MKKVIILGLTTLLLMTGCGSTEEKEPISCNPWDEEILTENILVEDIIVEEIQVEEIVVNPITIK